jgi:isoquinoline 1-oxidoreductase beta subunit
MERAGQMADWGKRRDGHGLGAAYIDYSGTQLAAVVEISIDRATGKTTVHNVWCAIDCGTAVQPDNVIAQTESSIVYGIGLALTERGSIRDGAWNNQISTITSYRVIATCLACMSKSFRPTIIRRVLVRWRHR